MVSSLLVLRDEPALSPVCVIMAAVLAFIIKPLGVQRQSASRTLLNYSASRSNQHLNEKSPTRATSSMAKLKDYEKQEVLGQGKSCRMCHCLFPSRLGDEGRTD